jgi:hypothetical protein
MRRTIDQFIWPFQSYFRTSVEGLAEGALERVGTALAPKAFLIGFANSEHARHDVCIEPERGPFAQSDLDGVQARADALYETGPLRNTVDSDPGLHEQRHAAMRDDARGQALCEALAASAGGAGRTFLAGRGVSIGDYVVYPVLSVVTTPWEALPALSTTRRERMPVDRSLPFAVVREVLRAASAALRQQPPPQHVDEEWDDIVRSAASRLVDSVVQVLLAQYLGSGFKDSIDAVAAQPYEGREGVGTLVLAASEHPQADIDVRFDRPVSVRATRELRKVLEMSGAGLSLMCDGAHVYGLGRLAAGYDPAAENAFVVTVVGRGSWELATPATDASDPVRLLRIDNGRASVPKDRLSKDKFLDTVDRLFPDAPDGSAGLLWDLALACARQAHGTMLVVHPEAAAEGHRLHPQALTISPTKPTLDALLAMTGIDGAVLVAPDANVHAVGVILDGTATGTGDPARGARYNSAVRYLAGEGKGALIIIVSEDGMINLLPDLQPRQNRDHVAEAVERVVAASTGTPDYETFHGLVRHVESLEFYLDQAQCDAVNAAQQTVDDHRSSRGGFSVFFKKLKPDPAMNDTYWV